MAIVKKTGMVMPVIQPKGRYGNMKKWSGKRINYHLLLLKIAGGYWFALFS
jgi:hypothetical protein